MAQGWKISSVTDEITFNEAPPAGTNNIVVKEFAAGAVGGTDIWAVGAWSARYGYPAETEYFGDRQWFGNTPSDPQVIWASVIGEYTNFGKSSPIVDSDSLSFQINARQVNAVYDFVPMDYLLLMTSGARFRTTGGQDDVITPSSIGVKGQGEGGASRTPAVVAGESALMVLDEGQEVIDLKYTFEKDGFASNSLSVWADHLFQGFTIRWMQYWKAPYRVVWMVRSDGTLLGCTYMPEQQVIGWHRHDTGPEQTDENGKLVTRDEVIDVCTLPGTTETECYFLTRRFIDGEWLQIVEQQAPTQYTQEEDLFYVDCGATYDGRNTGNTTLTLSTATDWTEEDELTLTASAPLFAGTSDVGDGFELFRVVDEVDPETDMTKKVRYRVILRIDSYVSSTVVKVFSVGTVPAPLRSTALATWTFQRDTIGGLWHLEGETVKVLQDKAVVGPYVVESGRIALDPPGGVVHVGLGYSGEIETLNLNVPGAETIRDAKKLAYECALVVLGTRGVRASGSDGKFYPVKERSHENYGQPPFMKTGVFTVPIGTKWDEDTGRIRVRSDDPLPMEILNLITRAVVS